MERWTYGLMQVKKDDVTHYMIDAPWLKGGSYEKIVAEDIKMYDDGDDIVYPLDTETMMPFAEAFYMKFRPEVLLREDGVITLKMEGSFYEENDRDTVIDVDLQDGGQLVLFATDPDGVAHDYVFRRMGGQLVIDI
ncbi:hypothetical protein IJG66_01155 [Candidatus Saccharibacteria bacterium]|nr:hypothetical protein [Candidatus Saccharibacteria bacterium]